MTRDRTRYPAIPFIFLYDEVGNQVFTNAGQFHTWDSAQTKSTNFDYTLDKDRIYLNNNQYGFYEITFECSYVTYEEADIAVTSQIYKNGEAVEGAKVTSSVTGGASQTVEVTNCQSIHFIVYLSGQDYIQVKTTTDNGGDTFSIAETSRVMIKWLPVKGWNNNAGGNEKTSYRGGVFR